MTANDASEPQMPVAEQALLWVVAVPRELEERVVDWLLGREDVASFSTAAVELHGADPVRLRGAERVSGRQRRTEFRVRIAASQLDSMTAALTEELKSADASWLAVPIAGEGRLG